MPEITQKSASVKFHHGNRSCQSPWQPKRTFHSREIPTRDYVGICVKLDSEIRKCQAVSVGMVPPIRMRGPAERTRRAREALYS